MFAAESTYYRGYIMEACGGVSCEIVTLLIGFEFACPAQLYAESLKTEQLTANYDPGR
jgi:hypothetical protein